jgi:predicted acyltransferase
MSSLQVIKKERILSIDVFRGLTMFLLIGEFTHLFTYMVNDSLQGTILFALGEQFHHHPWNGLRFWDLIQPFFMFIVGLSLPFAVRTRKRKGDDQKKITRHVIKRSIILFILGWALYCIGPGEITFRFQNVLAQIAVTYLIAYLIMERSVTFQVIFSLGLLILTELLYRYFPVEGFNHPFTPNENFGTWFDLQYGGADLYGHWVSFNAIPTAAHTIWGVLVGQLLMNESTKKRKMGIMVVVGISLIVTGYLLDPVTPIIKRISTSSFVIVSGGWSILTMGLFYGILDFKQWKGKWTLFFQVIGMNSLFIYLFAHVEGADFIEKILHPFTYIIYGWGDVLTAEILTSITVWFALWGLCYWMYKKRILIKI